MQHLVHSLFVYEKSPVMWWLLFRPGKKVSCSETGQISKKNTAERAKEIFNGKGNEAEKQNQVSEGL